MLSSEVPFSIGSSKKSRQPGARNANVQMANEVGKQSVILRVEDGRGGAGLQSFTITVGNENYPPAFTTLAKTTVAAGQTYQYAAHAVDPQGFPLTYSLTTYPTGMTINSSTGLITWPNPTPTGTQNVVVQVADPYGALTTQGFALLVVNDLPPVFTSTPKLAADVGLLYQYTAVATNPNGAQALTYSLVSPPSGMSINANTQVALSSTTRVPNVLLVLNELQGVQSLGFEHYLRAIPLGPLFRAPLLGSIEGQVS